MSDIHYKLVCTLHIGSPSEPRFRETSLPEFALFRLVDPGLEPWIYALFAPGPIKGQQREREEPFYDTKITQHVQHKRNCASLR